MTRWPLILTMLAAALPAAAQEGASAASEMLTLDQAIGFALQNNRRLASASLEVERSDEKVQVAETYRMPSVDLKYAAAELLTHLSFEFDRGSFGTFQGIGPFPPEDVLITEPRQFYTAFLATATQPLSQLHRINMGVRAEEASRDIAREDLRLARQSVVHAVKSLYYGILQSESALAAAGENVRLLREIDRVVADRVAQQAALPVESLDVKTRLAGAEYEALRVRNAIAAQEERLNDLMGRDAGAKMTLAPVPETLPAESDLEAARARSLQQHPEVREARLRLTQAEYDRSIKKAERWPDLSLLVAYLSFSDVQVLPRNFGSAGILMSWDPMEWNRNRIMLAQKSRTVDQAAIGLREAESSIGIEVNQRFRALAEARAAVEVGRLAQETAKERLRITMNRYQQQSALLKDTLEAEAALAEASHRHQQALLSFWAARADFEKALGED